MSVHFLRYFVVFFLTIRRRGLVLWRFGPVAWKGSCVHEEIFTFYSVHSWTFEKVILKGVFHVNKCKHQFTRFKCFWLHAFVSTNALPLRKKEHYAVFTVYEKRSSTRPVGEVLWIRMVKYLSIVLCMVDWGLFIIREISHRFLPWLYKFTN